MIEREKKRERLNKKYLGKIKTIKEKLKDKNTKLIILYMYFLMGRHYEK